MFDGPPKLGLPNFFSRFGDVLGGFDRGGFAGLLPDVFATLPEGLGGRNGLSGDNDLSSLGGLWNFFIKSSTLSFFSILLPEIGLLSLSTGGGAESLLILC